MFDDGDLDLAGFALFRKEEWLGEGDFVDDEAFVLVAGDPDAGVACAGSHGDADEAVEELGIGIPIGAIG